MTGKPIYIFSKKNLNEIIRSARKTAANGYREICGMLIGREGHIFPIPTKNLIKRGGSFQISYRDFLKIKKACKVLNFRILGTFHSHPLSFAKPGLSDIKYAQNDSLMLIIDCIGREALLWKIKNKEARRIKFDLV